jgi:hypothetical protein
VLFVKTSAQDRVFSRYAKVTKKTSGMQHHFDSKKQQTKQTKQNPNQTQTKQQ